MSLEVTISLKPKAGLRVCDPTTGRPLADEGEIKPLTVFWQRRLNDGDVEIVGAPAKKGK